MTINDHQISKEVNVYYLLSLITSCVTTASNCAMGSK
jgi:hypothetical protein